MEVKAEVIIIGAGLTGLTLAYYLKKKNISCIIVEARDRIGGRIFTKQNGDAFKVDLGATWFGKAHQELIQLLNELDVKVFEQVLGETAIYEPISTSPPQVVRLPPNNDPSYRIVGGSEQIINNLQDELSTSQIYFSNPIDEIELQGDRIVAKSKEQNFSGQMLVSTLPPNLFTNTIKVNPILPEEFISVASETQTWMGESIKFGLFFEKPFWKEKNISGTMFSNVGPVPELYDHSSFNGASNVLMGFLNSAYFELSKNERYDLIMNQLKRYFGNEVSNCNSYEECVWKLERYTTSDYKSHVLPHQNNGHTVYQNGYLNKRLYFGGTETSPVFSGYMEGAVSSAKYILNQICNNLDV